MIEIWSPEKSDALSKVTQQACGKAKNSALILFASGLVIPHALPQGSLAHYKESPGTPGSNPTPATSELGDLGHMESPLWAFISLPGKWK